MDENGLTTTQTHKTGKDKHKGGVAIPFVKGLSESIARIMKEHIMRPHRKAFVYPKDKVETENSCDVVYEVSCHNCELKYIDEMGRKFNTREIQKDAKNVPQVYTRSERKSSETCLQKRSHKSYC